MLALRVQVFEPDLRERDSTSSAQKKSKTKHKYLWRGMDMSPTSSGPYHVQRATAPTLPPARLLLPTLDVPSPLPLPLPPLLRCPGLSVGDFSNERRLGVGPKNEDTGVLGGDHRAARASPLCRAGAPQGALTHEKNRLMY